MKKILIGIGILLGIYLALTNITVNNTQEKHSQYIYLNDNGIHVDIIIPSVDTIEVIEEDGIRWYSLDTIYTSYGWGSEIFYTQVPTWDDLTFTLAFKALFTHPRSIMNVFTYNNIKSNWVKVSVSENQFEKLVENINKEFIIKSNYHIFNTCNTWVNRILKESGLKACLWTPFSRDIIKMYN